MIMTNYKLYNYKCVHYKLLYDWLVCLTEYFKIVTVVDWTITAIKQHVTHDSWKCVNVIITGSGTDDWDSLCNTEHFEMWLECVLYTLAEI